MVCFYIGYNLFKPVYIFFLLHSSPTSKQLVYIIPIISMLFHAEWINSVDPDPDQLAS